ncbi:hypothetical protein [Actinosynnema mirum]|uniref:hypothetical protein n=1 Tax=Actinosynnema mirum TaxID=40567 RepID=UPI00019AB9B0|nr:hypothetical protein [Actinosynnema mirum]
MGRRFGAALALAREPLGHEQVQLDRGGQASDHLVQEPQSGLVGLGELETGTSQGLLQQGLFTEEVRVQAQIAVGGVGGAADPDPGSAQVDGLGADHGDGRAVIAERFHPVEQGVARDDRQLFRIDVRGSSGRFDRLLG